MIDLPVGIARCAFDALGADPGGRGWLGPRERPAFERLRIEPRRQSFLAGRMAAKRALRATVCPRAPLDEVEVVPAPDGAPEAFLDGWPLPVAISISHNGSHNGSRIGSGGGEGEGLLAACAVVEQRIAIGIDIEAIEPRSAAFVADYLTAREQRAVTAATDEGGAAGAALAANLIWSAKESALKALRQGLREDTLAVEVEVEGGALRAEDAPWAPLAARHRSGARFCGWWRRDGGRVWTVLGAVPLAVPRELSSEG